METLSVEQLIGPDTLAKETHLASFHQDGLRGMSCGRMTWYRLVDQADVQQVDPVTSEVLPDRKTVYGKFAYIFATGERGAGKEILVDAHTISLIAQHNINWDIHPEGYAQARSRVKGRTVRLHHVVMDGPAPEGKTRDHLNQDKLDNRQANLAFKTKSEQQINRGTWGACEFKGVSFHKATGKWRAQININGKQKHLGYYHTPEAARDAYNAAAAKRARDMESSDEEGQAPIKIQKTINNYFGTVNINNNNA